MDERFYQEAMGHITSAAAAFETAVTEIRGAFREGRFDSESVGSPAYVQRLRDHMVTSMLGCPGYDHRSATAEAHRAIAYLGYPPVDPAGDFLRAQLQRTEDIIGETMADLRASDERLRASAPDADEGRP